MKAGSGIAKAGDVRSATIDAALTASNRLGNETPSLAVLLVSASFGTDDAEIALESLHEAISVDRVIGCVAETVIGDAHEAEDESAVSVWLASTNKDVSTFHVRALGPPEEPVFEGYPEGTSTRILIADPFTFPAGKLLEGINAQGMGGLLVGGMASGATAPGETRLFVDDRVEWAGAVGAELPGVDILTAVSQGCRPIGRVFTVTRAEGNVIFELGGSTPLQQIRSLYEELTEEERALVSGGLLLGRVIDEYKTEFDRGDFLVRGVAGLDPSNGAIAVADEVGIGQTVQFHVRDAASADEDLVETLNGLKGSLGPRPAEGALLFTCNGRGSRLFGSPSHDAALVSSSLGTPLAGFFAAGELGPVGGSNFFHGFTASLALFTER